jgi:hypothetical protein
MGGIASEKFITGNRVFLYARGDGQRDILGEAFVGRISQATAFDARIGTGASYVRVIGTADPAGIVDTAHDYRISLTMVKFSDEKALEKAKAEPIDIDAVDAFTSARLATAEECHLESSGFRVNANQLVMSEMSFLAMRVVSI